MHAQTAALAFLSHDEPICLQPFGQGNINRTYKVTTASGRQYILQQINHHIFRDPTSLMANVCAVTDFLRRKDSDPLHTLHFLPTGHGAFVHQDLDGNFWRMYSFIPGQTLEKITDPTDFYRCGLGFGKFQMLLADFPAHTLRETIPNFHNTPQRYHQLRAAIAADRAGRAQQVQTEIDFLLAHEAHAGILQQRLDAGILPLRVTHNDTKLSNILFDSAGLPQCILDLDTVMPGLSAMDFGDAIRSGAATAPEDETDTDKMALDLALFQAFTEGFLEATTTLTPAELDALPLAPLVITLEQACRFLTDYLEGDVYYHISYPTHNLVRTRAQIALATDMLAKMPLMERIIKDNIKIKEEPYDTEIYWR